MAKPFCNCCFSSIVVLNELHLSRWSTTLQLSDIDARVIDELLSDAAFLESLMEQEVQLEGEAADDGQAGVIGNNTGTDSSSGSALGLVGEAPSSRYASVYESATMQAVEGVQLSVKGIVAKLSAAFESAGKLIQDRDDNHDTASMLASNHGQQWALTGQRDTSL